MSYKRYWVALAIVIIGFFAVLWSRRNQVGKLTLPMCQTLTDSFTGNSRCSPIARECGSPLAGRRIGTVWGSRRIVAPD